MFDFDGAKLIIIGIVMLIVIKPKDLPGVMRQVGHAVAHMRRMAAEFQGQFAEAMREADLQDLKKDVEKASKMNFDAMNPIGSIRDGLAATRADIEAKLKAPGVAPPATSAATSLDAAPAPRHDAPLHDETPAPGALELQAVHHAEAAANVNDPGPVGQEGEAKTGASS